MALEQRFKFGGCDRAMTFDTEEDDAFLVVGEQRSNDATSLWRGMLITLTGIILVATVFGGIHCIGWSFDFPSHTEQLLWRISSISITAIPLGIVCLAGIGAVMERFASGLFEYSASMLILLLTPLYIISQVLLLVLSLTTLRSLPSSAFQTVEWTTFLPHV